VTGETYSSNFPTTPGAFDRTHGGSRDAFVTRLGPAGSAPSFSTFLGGGDLDGGQAIAVDQAGSAYVTGDTRSGDFPTVPGSFDRTFNGGFSDAFVTKLGSVGSALSYSTFLGGGDLDSGRGIAVNRGGRAYVTGETYSSNFPTTPGAFDRTHGGFFSDAFVTKVATAAPPGPGCTITGTPGNDRLVGTSGRDVICGLGGNDHITGLRGHDVILAGPGADVAIGGVGNDRVRGGPGRDHLRGDFPNHRPGADVLRGNDGADRLVATDGVSGNDTADGGAGTDACSADPGDVVISCP
jgi:Ca2+-binding RTX toxin-like protein